MVESKALVNGTTIACKTCFNCRNLIGEKFGKLTVIEKTDKRYGGGQVVWKCACDCGEIVFSNSDALVRGRKQSCGCARGIDISGKRFGRLTVVSKLDERRNGNILWRCLCDCGNYTVAPARTLICGASKSCGCLIVDTLKAQVGELNPNWNPNLTAEQRVANRNHPEYAKWRDAVYKRDNYTCQKCGRKASGHLVAHHIESYTDNKELRTVLSNGITLCEKHHNDFHHQYGRGNNTREQLNEFLEGSKQ